MAVSQAGDVVQLVGRDSKYFIIRLAAGQRLETHRGIMQHNDLIGQELGSEVLTHLGHPFFLIEPSGSSTRQCPPIQVAWRLPLAKPQVPLTR